MKVTVTGASGFVGTQLCRHLIDQGDEVLPFGSGPQPLDVLDRDGVYGAIKGSEADALYHLAAQSHVGSSFHDSVETIRVNVEGTLNVLDACAEAGVGRVLLVGSSEQYGSGGDVAGLLTEDLPQRPVSPYGASKVAAEVLGLQAFLSNGLETVMTRSFNHTGPGQSPKFVVPALAGRIARAESDGLDEIEVGNLDAIREFNDVRDVVRAYRLLLLTGKAGGVYNVCSGVSFAIYEVAERLLTLATRPLRLRQTTNMRRPHEPRRLVGDPTRLKDLTGWSPQYSIDETLRDTLNEARHRSASLALRNRQALRALDGSELP